MLLNSLEEAVLDGEFQPDVIEGADGLEYR